MAAISKKTCHIDPKFHVHTLGVYVHIPARYEVSTINAVTGTAVHQTTPMMMTMTMMPMMTPMTHDGQTMIA